MLKMLKKWASEVKDLLNNHGFFLCIVKDNTFLTKWLSSEFKSLI